MKRKVTISIILIVVFATIGYFISIWENISFKAFYSLKDVPKPYISALKIEDNPVGYCKTIVRNTRMPISQLTIKQGIITIYSVKLSIDDKLTDLVTLNNNLDEVHLDVSEYTSLENYTRIDYDIMHTQKTINGIELNFLKTDKVKRFIQHESLLAYFIPNTSGFEIKYRYLGYDDMAVRVEGIDTFEKKKPLNPRANLIIALRKINKEIIVYILHKRDDETREITERDFYTIFKY